MIKKRRIAEDLLNRIEKLPLDDFERELLENLLEKFIQEETAREKEAKPS